MKIPIRITGGVRRAPFFRFIKNSKEDKNEEIILLHYFVFEIKNSFLFYIIYTPTIIPWFSTVFWF